MTGLLCDRVHPPTRSARPRLPKIAGACAPITEQATA